MDRQSTRFVISRRGFIKRAAAVSLAPCIVPSSVFGAAAPSNRIRMGMIGVGDRGRSHVVDIHRFKEQAEIVAICDVNAENCKQTKEMLAQMHGKDDCVAYEDYRELLARDDIDAVLIAVPDHWHALPAVAAAEAGKHVYSEKPLAYTLAEGRAMVDAVQRRGVVFQHGTQQRSMPNFRLACELARNGRLGKIHTINVGSPYGKQGGSTQEAAPPEGLNYEFWLGPAPYKPYTPGRCDGRNGDGWYQIRDYSGGWMTAWGSHDIDIAQWGNGTDDTGPVEVEGTGEYATGGAYDTLWKWHAECRYENGVKLIYATENENPHGIKFEGDEGWVFVNRGKIEASKESLLKETFGPDEIHLLESENHMGNFFAAIRGETKPAAPIDVAHRSTSICHLFNITIQLGRKLRWNPESERFVDDDAANALLSSQMREPWKL